jgi:hypothetical protein
MPAHTAREAVRCLLLDLLDRAFDQRSWHGPNIAGAIRGVSAGVAARSVHGRKSIWQQVLHAAYWKQRALNHVTRPARPARFPRRGSNWPAVPSDRSEAAWRGDVELLRDTHERLRAAVQSLPPARLDPKTVWLIQGAAAHDVYHAGQIKLLRRLI